MGFAQKKDRTSVEGFDELWQPADSSDHISKQIQAILKVLVDERIEHNKEHALVGDLKGHVSALESQIQKLNWQLGQREQELSSLHTENQKLKSERSKLEKHSDKHNDLMKENFEIRRLAEQLSNQVMQEKSKNEMLVDLLRELKQPELVRIEKKLGI